MKSNLENLNFQTSIREQVVPSRKKVNYLLGLKLPNLG